MPNYTLKIQSCKIHEFRVIADNHAYGKVSWQENGVEFQKSFITYSIDARAIIEANKYNDSSFSIEGYLIKKAGTGQHLGKLFENIILTSCQNL